MQALQNIHDATVFDFAILLFEEKWENEIPEFLDYFFDNWINSKWENWYKGSIPAGFSTINNGIEGFNFAIKEKYTNWERLKLEDFILILQEIINDYSDEIKSKKFPTEVHIREEL